MPYNKYMYDIRCRRMHLDNLHFGNFLGRMPLEFRSSDFVALAGTQGGAEPPMRPAYHLDTQNTVFDSLDTQKFRSGFADDDNFRRWCMWCHPYSTKKAVAGIKKQNL